LKRDEAVSFFNLALGKLAASNSFLDYDCHKAPSLMSLFDYADKEKLTDLIREARELRKQSDRLHEKTETLRKRVEEQANKQEARQKNKK
jgi:hypothetical protein